MGCQLELVEVVETGVEARYRFRATRRDGRSIIVNVTGKTEEDAARRAAALARKYLGC